MCVSVRVRVWKWTYSFLSSSENFRLYDFENFSCHSRAVADKYTWEETPFIAKVNVLIAASWAAVNGANPESSISHSRSLEWILRKFAPSFLASATTSIANRFKVFTGNTWLTRILMASDRNYTGTVCREQNEFCLTKTIVSCQTSNCNQWLATVSYEDGTRKHYHNT